MFSIVQTSIKTPKHLKSTNQRIILIRQQICNIKKQRHTLPIEIYHDQLEDLYATLNDIKRHYLINKKDNIDEWCVQNPSDLECRIYYY